MTHTPTQLEQIFYQNEGLTDPETILREIKEAVDAEPKAARIEKVISRRVHAMMSYLFGACNKERRAKVLEPIGTIVANNVSEMADPELLIEEFATDETFNPQISIALASMEDALHAEKDMNLPAGKKVPLRELFAQREALMKRAA